MGYLLLEWWMGLSFLKLSGTSRNTGKRAVYSAVPKSFSHLSVQGRRTPSTIFNNLQPGSYLGVILKYGILNLRNACIRISEIKSTGNRLENDKSKQFGILNDKSAKGRL